MTHSLACAIRCSVPLVFSFSSLLNLGSKTRSCTQQSAGFSPTPPFQRGVPCISGEPVSVALLNCENLSLVDCQTCCALSMPAVGHALLSSTLRIGLRVSSAPVACCHATALLFVSFVCIFGRSSRIAMPTLCSSCATGCSLLPARVIRACFLLTRIRSSG